MIPQGSLKRIALGFFNLPPNNQDFNPASVLMPSSTTTDQLSLAIHAISQFEHLTHLELAQRIVISPLLFWPDTQIKPPYWPNLVSVEIAFSMNTADGGWYFTRENNANDKSHDDDDDASTDTSSADGSEADDDSTTTNQDPDIPDTYNATKVAFAIGEEPYSHFRTKADPDKLDPLFEAAARAAAQMPRLRRMWLKTYVYPPGMFDFAMAYLAPGEMISQGPGSGDVDVPRLEWVVGASGYEPAESILELWRRAKGEVVQRVTEGKE